MLFKGDLALQNLPLSKQPFQMQPKLKMKTSLEVPIVLCPLGIVHAKFDKSILTTS